MAAHTGIRIPTTRTRIPTPIFQVGTRTLMSDHLLKLASWLSPSFPVGAFTYSHGLETAIADGAVHDPASLQHWITDVLEHGAGRTDAIFLAHAYRAPEDAEIAELAFALAPSAERLLETEAQGAAFAETTAAAWGGAAAPVAYPIAVGRAAATHEIPLLQTVEFFLHAFASNLISAAVRLVPLGQTDGQRVLAALTPIFEVVATDAMASDLDDIGGCAIASDIASMRHETLSVRLFRS